MSNDQTQPTTTALAPKSPNVLAATQIRGYLEKRRLHLPENYSAENALKLAWITIQNNNLVNGVTETSIVRALIHMVIQGLDPSKTQCYFIRYGQSLNCQRSYFGDMAVCKRIKPGIDFFYSAYYKGDKIETERKNGRLIGVTHDAKIENQSIENLAGAYCLAIDETTGEVINGTLMTIDEIKMSWTQSKTYKPDSNVQSPHTKFPADMALRTVIRKCCKPIINSSDDEMLAEAIRESQVDQTDAQMAEAEEQFANAEMIGIDEEIVDAQFTPDEAEPTDQAEPIGETVPATQTEQTEEAPY